MSYTALVLIMLSSFLWDVQWDLTSDQRNTLSPHTKEWVTNIKQPLAITTLLTGDNVPASFQGYAAYLDHFLSEVARLNPLIEIFYQDPNDGPPEQVQGMRRALSARGVEPIRRQVATQEESSSALLYPYLSIGTEKDIAFLDLLESQGAGSESEKLVRSQEAFEAKFVRVLRGVTIHHLPQVHVVGSHAKAIADGLNRDASTADFRFVPSDGHTLLAAADSVDAIIAVVREQDLDRETLLAIDVIGGGDVPVIWCVDRFDISIDSLRSNRGFMAISDDFLVDDYLFRYGVRIEPEVVLDMQSRRIPQVVNGSTANAQTKLVQFPYHLAVVPNEDAPIEARLNSAVSLSFASPIQLMAQPTALQKDTLLTTSQYTANQKAPLQVHLANLHTSLDPDRMDQGEQIIAARVKGRTSPYLKHRLLPSEQTLLSRYNLAYRDSQYIDQVIIADTDFLIPTRLRDGRYPPIGFDRYEQHLFDANTKLIQRLLESQIYGDQLLHLSQRQYQVVLLDGVKYQERKGKYAMIILALPLLLMLLSYLVYHLVRRRKYAY